MRKVVVFMNLTLDGVMQAPGRPDEDRRGGFEHGGWAMPYADQEMGKVAAESMATTGALVLGRRTYEDFYSVWPNRTDDNPFTGVLNSTPKYVASTTLEEPLPWVNSTLLQGDGAMAVAKLKEQPGKDLVILGSGELVRSLMRRNLIDVYMLQISPAAAGSGPPAVLRRGIVCRSQARGQQDDDHWRDNRHLPAGVVSTVNSR